MQRTTEQDAARPANTDHLELELEADGLAFEGAGTRRPARPSHARRATQRRRRAVQTRDGATGERPRQRAAAHLAEHLADLVPAASARRSPSVLSCEGLKANSSDFLLSQYVVKLSLHSVLLSFSNEGDL